MTYEAFLKKLGLTTGWRIMTVLGAPWIRRRETECPIAVAADMNVTDAILGGFTVAGLALTDIMAAADGDPLHDPAIRHDLLVACGLAGTEQAS